jgi:hypothetical protein
VAVGSVFGKSELMLEEFREDGMYFLWPSHANLEFLSAPVLVAGCYLCARVRTLAFEVLCLTYEMVGVRSQIQVLLYLFEGHCLSLFLVLAFVQVELHPCDLVIQKPGVFGQLLDFVQFSADLSAPIFLVGNGSSPFEFLEFAFLRLLLEP